MSVPDQVAPAAEALPVAARRQGGRRRTDLAARILVPLLVVAALIGLWDRFVVWNEIPPYTLPRPGAVVSAMVEQWPSLRISLGNTLAITLGGLALATLGGVALAILLAQSRLIEYSLSPIVVTLQVTPIVAVFPLINIYVEAIIAKLLLCVWIVAFFPILSNTTLGLKSVDRNLVALFRLYGASGWQTLRLLTLPAAMPYFLGGLRIAGGLALIGAVVAEYVAGRSGFGTGLATRIIEAGYRLNIPLLFAALVLISLTGVAIYTALALVSHLVLKDWHDSATDRKR